MKYGAKWGRIFTLPTFSFQWLPKSNQTKSGYWASGKVPPFKTFHQKVTLRYSEPCNIFEKNMQKLVWFIKLIWDQIYQCYCKFKNGFSVKFSWLLIENRVPLICAIYISSIEFSTISMEYFLPRIMDNISSCLGNLSAVDPLVRTAQDPTFFKHDSNANRNTISQENIPKT